MADWKGCLVAFVLMAGCSAPLAPGEPAAPAVGSSDAAAPEVDKCLWWEYTFEWHAAGLARAASNMSGASSLPAPPGLPLPPSTGFSGTNVTGLAWRGAPGFGPIDVSLGTNVTVLVAPGTPGDEESARGAVLDALDQLFPDLPQAVRDNATTHFARLERIGSSDHAGPQGIVGEPVYRHHATVPVAADLPAELAAPPSFVRRDWVGPWVRMQMQWENWSAQADGPMVRVQAIPQQGVTVVQLKSDSSGAAVLVVRHNDYAVGALDEVQARSIAGNFLAEAGLSLPPEVAMEPRHLQDGPVFC